MTATTTARNGAAMNKPKIGRPRLDPNGPRRAHISLSLPQELLDAIKAASVESRLSTSQYLERLIRGVMTAGE